MALSFYDITVPNYLQILNAVSGVLEKGKAHCEENGISLDDVVATRLIDDMNPFRFQVISVVHHSEGAMKGYESGEFAPPNGYGEPDYAGLQALVQGAIDYISSKDEAMVNSWQGGQVTFKLGGNELPFTTENFAQTFSMPNFYFHAATTYDILRMKGAPLGKRDFLGAMRMGV
ncbi:MAG: DUF1993 domain-containing protein [Pseudomonadales bacterium]|jgi:hypothetical protein|nr:DUF1993 domain-containing protein [Pseudomonadales bacterium]